MSTDNSRPIYRGLIIPDPAITGPVWEDETTVTQDGAQPGIPQPGRDTELTIKASGTPEADATLEITACRNGFPARDLGVRVAVRTEDTPERPWRGHWAAHLMAGHEQVPASAGQQDGAGLQGQSPSIATHPDGGALAVWSTRKTGDAFGGYVRASYRSPGGHWSNTGGAGADGFLVALVNPGSSLLPLPHCAVVVLPNGRALCFVAHPNADGLTRVDTYSSLDNGTTWERNAPAAAPGFDTARWTVVRMSAAYGGPGEVCLLLSVADSSAPIRDDVLMQFASADLGASFQLVELQDGDGLRKSETDPLRASGSHDVVGDRAGFLVTYAEPNDPDANLDQGVIYARRLSSAYSTFGNAVAVQIASIADNGLIADFAVWAGNPDQAVAVDRNGTLWVYWRQYALDPGDSKRWASVSTDGGATWTIAGVERLPLVGSGPGTTYSLRRLSACWDRGRVLLLHGYSQLGQNWEQALYVQVFGGWHAPNAPTWWDSATPGSLASQAHASYFMLPANSPDVAGWTLEAAGTTASEVNGFTLTVAAQVAGSHIRWTADLVGGTKGDVTCTVTPNVGDVGMSLQVSDGLAAGSGGAYAVVRAGEVEVVDLAGGILATATGIPPNSRVQIAMGIDAHGDATVTPPAMSCWYRLVSTTDMASDPAYTYDPPWVLLYSGALANGGASASTAKYGALGFTGLIESGSFTHWDVRLQLQSGLESIDISPRTWAANPGPTELEGRALTVIPEHALDGVYLSAHGGPSFSGDTWTHTPAYDFGVINLAPRAVRSPSQGFQALDDSTQVIAWDLVGDALPTYVETPVLALHVVDTNAPAWDLQGYDEVGNAWVTLASFDVRDSFGNFTTDVKAGAAVLQGLSVPPADALAYYLADQELVGGTLWDAVGDPYPITRNTGGLVSTTLDEETTRSPRIFVDGTPTQGPTGNTQIMPKSFTVLVRVDGLDDATNYRGYRIRVNTTGAPVTGGKVRVGKAILGSAYLFGLDYDLTKTYTRRSAVDVDEDASGQVYTRKRGPTRRSLSVRWQGGGVWTRGIYELADDEYTKFSDAADAWPVALLHEVPPLLDGIMDKVSGPHVPIVVLQDVPRLVDPATYVVLARNRAAGAIYSHLTGPITFAVDAGQYGQDEKVSMGFEVAEEV